MVHAVASCGEPVELAVAERGAAAFLDGSRRRRGRGPRRACCTSRRRGVGRRRRSGVVGGGRRRGRVAPPGTRARRRRRARPGVPAMPGFAKATLSPAAARWKTTFGEIHPGVGRRPLGRRPARDRARVRAVRRPTRVHRLPAGTHPSPQASTAAARRPSEDNCPCNGTLLSPRRARALGFRNAALTTRLENAADRLNGRLSPESRRPRRAGG